MEEPWAFLKKSDRNYGFTEPKVTEFAVKSLSQSGWKCVLWSPVSKKMTSKRGSPVTEFKFWGEFKGSSGAKAQPR